MATTVQPSLRDITTSQKAIEFLFGGSPLRDSECKYSSISGLAEGHFDAMVLSAQRKHQCALLSTIPIFLISALVCTPLVAAIIIVSTLLLVQYLSAEETRLRINAADLKNSSVLIEKLRSCVAIAAGLNEQEAVEVLWARELRYAESSQLEAAWRAGTIPASIIIDTLQAGGGDVYSRYNGIQDEQGVAWLANKLSFLLDADRRVLTVR